MQQIFKSLPVKWVLGNEENINLMLSSIATQPYENKVLEYLQDVSKILLKNKESKQFPEVITFAFWIRKASLAEKKQSSEITIDNRLGRGIAFHISPSNVPVNFAYSLVAGLLAGNANIVKLPSKQYAQIDLIIDALYKAFKKHEHMRNYIVCVRYDRNKSINDAFSSICASRLIWGGDSTIQMIRESKLPARSNEVTFSNRYSIAVIDSDSYLQEENKNTVATRFFNDTYLSDQNACTSPSLVFWLGNNKDKAKKDFWEYLYQKVRKDYSLQAVQSIAKLTKLFEWSAHDSNLNLVSSSDNLITRVAISSPSISTVKDHGHSGLFLEYDANDMSELLEFCNHTQCQTVSYYGDIRETLCNFARKYKPKGIDRIVPLGETMNFDLTWDGVDLISSLSRVINIH